MITANYGAEQSRICNKNRGAVRKQENEDHDAQTNFYRGMKIPEEEEEE